MSSSTFLEPILVTGGAGFLGRYLAQALAGEGHRITVLDDLSCENSTFDCTPLQDPKIHCIAGSIFDATLVTELVAEHPIVCHLASVVGVQETMHRTSATIENLNGTLNLVGCLTSDHTALFTSSADVYGLHSHHHENRAMQEDDHFTFEHAGVKRWVYSHVKALEEHLIGESVGRSVNIRVFNSYGPQMDYPAPKRVIPSFIASVLAGHPLKLAGDGSQRRSMCYVDDTIRGLLLALAHAKVQSAGWTRCYNIGNPECFTIRQLAEQILRVAVSVGLIDSPLPIESHAFRYTETFDDSWSRVPDIDRATTELGFTPTVGFSEGLLQTLEYYRNQTRPVGAGS